jgi:hypothetical protein
MRGSNPGNHALPHKGEESRKQPLSEMLSRIEEDEIWLD